MQVMLCRPFNRFREQARSHMGLGGCLSLQACRKTHVGAGLLAKACSITTLCWRKPCISSITKMR